MKNENLGLVRVCAVSPYVKLADPISNAESIISEIKEAENEKVGFILFPELALTGKSCGDLFFQEHLYNSQLDALNKIVLSTKESRICVIIGLYVKCLGELVNCAGVIQNGEIKGIVPKIYPPKVAAVEPASRGRRRLGTLLGVGAGGRCFSTYDARPMRLPAGSRALSCRARRSSSYARGRCHTQPGHVANSHR